ncbi:hypothetical protein CKO38_04280 [Rhodospirillum rubrum]|uniref:hypothetical protein n=1 Tax=Rhodospirillum rubrum TaxID=1085 RepID=UPI00190495EC|nr:hypothetical protein [Rhodospirillum rubrum]MBK1663852.1 hypothetical protein [Rhodospirillum rubrum]MBK1675903.1 hypothetical protein [Rhodospirillum rubrum]
MVIFDANFLLLLLDPDVDVPKDPATGRPLTRAKDRVEALIATLSKQREAIGIPTPVIAEILVHAGSAGPRYLSVVNNTSRFRILPFDLRSAIELAAMTASAIAAGDKRSGSLAPWQKVKVDRQIAAIAIVGNASSIYTDDEGVMTLAKATKIPTISSWDLPLPPEDTQGTLDI